MRWRRHECAAIFIQVAASIGVLGAAGAADTRLVAGLVAGRCLSRLAAAIPDDLLTAKGQHPDSFVVRSLSGKIR